MMRAALRLHERLFAQDGRGPVLGGLMGGFSPRSVLPPRQTNLSLPDGCFLLQVAQRRTPAVTLGGSQPAPFVPRWARGVTRRRRPDGGFFIMQLVGQVPAALWVIFGEDRFHWDATTIGISLAAFGILHSLARAMITGPVAARLGERRALMLGMIADGTGYIPLAFATRGWDGVPDHGPACFGWHRNAGAASNVVRAGG